MLLSTVCFMDIHRLKMPLHHCYQIPFIFMAILKVISRIQFNIGTRGFFLFGFCTNFQEGTNLFLNMVKCGERLSSPGACYIDIHKTWSIKKILERTVADLLLTKTCQWKYQLFCHEIRFIGKRIFIFCGWGLENQLLFFLRPAHVDF